MPGERTGSRRRRLTAVQPTQGRIWQIQDARPAVALIPPQ